MRAKRGHYLATPNNRFALNLNPSTIFSSPPSRSLLILFTFPPFLALPLLFLPASSSSSSSSEEGEDRSSSEEGGERGGSVWAEAICWQASMMEILTSSVLGILSYTTRRAWWERTGERGERARKMGEGGRDGPKRDRRDDELLRMSPPIRRGYMDARGSGHVRLMNRQLLLAYAVRTNTKEARHISSFIRGLTCMRMKGKPFVLLD
jgi:hypothetical protein